MAQEGRGDGSPPKKLKKLEQIKSLQHELNELKQKAAAEIAAAEQKAAAEIAAAEQKAAAEIAMTKQQANIHKRATFVALWEFLGRAVTGSKSEIAAYSEKLLGFNELGVDDFLRK